MLILHLYYSITTIIHGEMEKFIKRLGIQVLKPIGSVT